MLRLAPSRARYIALIFSVLSIPAALFIGQVRESSSQAESEGGWAALAISYSDLGKLGNIRARIVFDPFYRLSDPSSSIIVDRLDVDLKKFASDDWTPARAYAVLLCKTPGSEVSSVHGALYLQGPARLFFPTIVHKSPPTIHRIDKWTALSGKLGSKQRSDLQVFDFTVEQLETCEEPRILKEGRNLPERGGDDTKSSFLVVGLGPEDRQDMTSNGLLGVKGPNLAFATPYVGGLPDEPSSPPGKYQFSTERNPPGLEGEWMMLSSTPSQIVSRSMPSNLRMRTSDPMSEHSDSLDIRSIHGVEGNVQLYDSDADALWKNLDKAGSIYLGIGIGVISSWVFEVAWSWREAHSTKAGVVQPKSTSTKRPSAGAAAAKSADTKQSPGTTQRKSTGIKRSSGGPTQRQQAATKQSPSGATQRKRTGTKRRSSRATQRKRTKTK